MTIYPAIDLRGGKCVRLMQGDFDKQTIYNADPLLQAQSFIDAGAEYIHIVDLDAAKNSDEPSPNQSIISRIAAFSIKLQTGGGVRNMNDIEARLHNGVSRVIIGSAAVENPELVREAVTRFGDKIAVGIDARDGYAAVRGWQDDSKINAVELAKKMSNMGVSTIIYTDISRDGMMRGINVAATKEIIDATGIHVIASGGVSSMSDIENAKAIGAEGIIIGIAIYNGALDLQQVIKNY